MKGDPGVASGHGKGQILVDGEVVRTVPEPKTVETLVEEAVKPAEGSGAADEVSWGKARHGPRGGPA